ncbi:DUF1269 domain-containing protein [Micromonospora sp. CPCC 205371]|nr:DUF1269 domain-containing protein [Micromonospora sp. CPCC 205371]
MSADELELGPIDYVVIEFPDGRVPSGAMPLLVELVERDTIRILDLVFVRKDKDGTLARLALADVDGDGRLGLAVFDGASSGLLDQDDIDEAGNAIEPGSAAAVLVYENHWAGPFATALRRSGAQLVSSGRIPITELVAALDSADETTT